MHLSSNVYGILITFKLRLSHNDESVVYVSGYVGVFLPIRSAIA